uniref:RRM domain-containing protein n=1 Tax=Alexandrium catenella TaxID=2925 RepID=A0A7S1RIQ1_ALECA|mmetsp:Transcript_59393/g.159030  ORF Transcript_59393/g.159030 Transcript_59393/m.159030 type:complete len:469 (+) Transcript_59393:95-1501(+)
MASTAVADPCSDFEFNPSAPEFIPHVQQDSKLWEGLPDMSPAFLSTAGASLSCRSLSRKAREGGPAAVHASGVPSPGSEDTKEGPAVGLRLVPREELAGGGASRRRPPVALAARAGVAEAKAPTPDKLRRQAARRATNAPEAPSQVATLVVKNLAMDLEKADVMKFLEERGAAATDVDLHLDAVGAFRGTAFARYDSPGKARVALEKLGVFPEFGGRKARVEIQKSKALFGRKCLEAGLPQEELGLVREEIECFVHDPARSEVGLPAGLTVQQRKYAHSLAERHNLVHATRQGECGEKYVFLSKARGEPFNGRKKAHSVTICTGSRYSTGIQGGKTNRRHAFSADEVLTYDSPPGIKPLPAYLNEPKLSGEPWIDDSILTPKLAPAAFTTSSPIVCAAPGLPLPPGLELEGLAMHGALPPPAIALLPKALGVGSPALGPDAAAAHMYAGLESLETTGFLLPAGKITEE